MTNKFATPVEKFIQGWARAIFSPPTAHFYIRQGNGLVEAACGRGKRYWYRAMMVVCPNTERCAICLKHHASDAAAIHGGAKGWPIGNPVTEDQVNEFKALGWMGEELKP